MKQYLLSLLLLYACLLYTSLRQVVITVGVGQQPVADELLIKGGLTVAGLVALQRPEAGGIGGQPLVAEDDVALLIQTELKLGVGDDEDVYKRQTIC